MLTWTEDSLQTDLYDSADDGRVNWSKLSRKSREYSCWHDKLSLGCKDTGNQLKVSNGALNKTDDQPFVGFQWIKSSALISSAWVLAI